MADTLDAIKQALGGYVREIARSLEKRAKLVADMNAAIAQASAKYQPSIDLEDEYIKGMMDQIKNLVAAHFTALFPTTKGTKELKLPHGVIKVVKGRPSYTVKDEAGLLELLRRAKIINKVAPAVRKISITELKKYGKLLSRALKLELVSSEGGGESLTVKPNDADVTGAPSLSRTI